MRSQAVPSSFVAVQRGISDGFLSSKSCLGATARLSASDKNSLPRCPPGLGLGDVLQRPGLPDLPEGLRLLLLLLALPTLKAAARLPMVSCPLVEVWH